jgi:hypothetical protein
MSATAPIGGLISARIVAVATVWLVNNVEFLVSKKPESPAPHA